MSIWISKGAICALLLAGCGGGISAPSVTKKATGTRGQEAISVASGDVVVAGPRGFCVDPASSTPQSDVPFIMLGNCASITGNRNAAQPGVKAVMTASVGPVDSGPTVSDGNALLETYFRSEPGRRALSRAQDPNSVTVIESFEEGGVFYLMSTDTSKSALADVAPEQWRAYMDINGRLVSAAVLGFRDAPLDATKGRSMIRSFAQTIQVKSAEGAPAAPDLQPTRIAAARPAAPRQTPTTRPWIGAEGSLRGVGMFRRIFGSN